MDQVSFISQTILRIVLHHTGGSHTPNATDRAAYHFIVGGDGAVFEGDHKPEANCYPSLTGRKYAAHTLNLNSYSLGVSMACMGGGDERKPFECRWFPTEVQTSAFIHQVALLCIKYNIIPTRKTVLTHAEVQATLGVKQKAKWDFNYDFLDRTATRDAIAIGDKIRARVIAEIARIKGQPIQTVKPAVAEVRNDVKPQMRNILRRGDRGEDVKAVQAALKIGADGIFGPATETAVKAFQNKNKLSADGIVGPATRAALKL